MTSTSTAPTQLAPGTSPGSSDDAIFAALEIKFGDKLGAALNDYFSHTDELCELLQDAAACAHWMEAARLAAQIRIGAEALGFSPIIYAAHVFADTAHNNASAHGLRNAAQTVVFEYERMRLAVMARFPDAIAPGDYSIA